MTHVNKEVMMVSQDEYARLIKRSNFLYCLEELGIDNWHGYGEAFTLYEEYYNERYDG
jgi:hypothetical protein